MSNFIEEFRQLLDMRRNATDAEEKAIIDKAIDRLIDNLPPGVGITIPAPDPWRKAPYSYPIITCCCGR